MGFSDALNEIGNPLDGMQESTMYSSRMGISALEFNTSLVIVFPGFCRKKTLKTLEDIVLLQFQSCFQVV